MRKGSTKISLELFKIALMVKVNLNYGISIQNGKYQEKRNIEVLCMIGQIENCICSLTLLFKQLSTNIFFKFLLYFFVTRLQHQLMY